MRRILTGLTIMSIIGLSGCSAWDAGGLAVGAGLTYWVVDPRAPNWNVKMDSVSSTDYRIELKMKNFIQGGQGEARMVFDHAAEKLARQERCPAYEVLAYEEGVDSEFLGGRRFAVGVIRLHRMASLEDQWMDQTGT